MQRDIFAFWSAMQDDGCVHPADTEVFNRCSHRFERDCLPLPFFGPLRTAPVVLLFLSPGFADPFDREHARTAAGQAYYAAQRTGLASLPLEADHPPAHHWCRRILRQCGLSIEDVAGTVAVLNIGPYHSRSFHDYPMMTALPSARVSLDFAQFTLFPQAEHGDRVVLCLRAARLWGLAPGQSYGRGLFASRCTQGGIMLRSPLRDAAIAAVRSRIGGPLSGRNGAAGQPAPAP